MWVSALGQKDPLEKGMAAHSSILAWRILWTEEPSGLHSMGSQRVEHDQNSLVHTLLKANKATLCYSTKLSSRDGGHEPAPPPPQMSGTGSRAS